MAIDSHPSTSFCESSRTVVYGLTIHAYLVIKGKNYEEEADREYAEFGHYVPDENPLAFEGVLIYHQNEVDARQNGIQGSGKQRVVIEVDQHKDKEYLLQLEQDDEDGRCGHFDVIVLV